MLKVSKRIIDALRYYGMFGRCKGADVHYNEAVLEYISENEANMNEFLENYKNPDYFMFTDHKYNENGYLVSVRFTKKGA